MRYLLLLLCLFSFILSDAQIIEHKQKSLGLQIGVPHWSTTLPEGRTYLPYQLMGYWNFYNILPKKKHNLWIYLEPQWVLVNYDPKDDFDLEFGANLGLKFEWALTKRSLLTAAIGSGPHVITVETTDQARGFIFSDNMEVGWRQLFPNTPWEVHLKWRWRHISNANLQKPNDGIDTFIIVLGVVKRLSK